jgi:transcriptional regulator with XRE-family HTH domain
MKLEYLKESRASKNSRGLYKPYEILLAVGEILKQRRKICGLTQKQVAESGLITQSELSKIEQGKREIGILLLIHLAMLYKQRIEDFVPKAILSEIALSSLEE